MSWIIVEDFAFPYGWRNPVEAAQRGRWYCEQLERSQIIFFSRPPFDLPAEDTEFLVAQRQADSRIHKNVSYRPQGDVLRGFSDGQETRALMHEVMRRYSAQVTQFVSKFLSPYSGRVALDFASYRPLEEAGRKLPLHKRNDLLHVDAFPSRPTRGGRILRVFTNLHPNQPRIWLTTDRFPALAQRFASDAGLGKFAGGSGAPLGGLWAGIARALHLRPAERSPYDSFMLRFHDYLKENSDFQANCSKTRLEFPPQSTWLVFTDSVPHAALSGRFALEQTFIVPLAATVSPQEAPIRVLERLCGCPLAA